MGSALAPQAQHIKAAANGPVLAPQHPQGLLQQAACGHIGAVVLQVQRGAGPVVLGNRLGGAGHRRAALVLGQRLGRKGMQACIACAHDAAHIARRARLDQCLGQRCRLDHEKPMPIRPGKSVAGVVVHGQRGRDVEQQQAAHGGGRIHGQAVRHAGTPVVRQHIEALKTMGLHDRQRVQRHLALAVVGMVGIDGGPRRIAVTAQVHQHQTVRLRQHRRHAVPHHHALRVAVQQQQGWSLPAHAAVQLHASALHGQG